MQPNYTAVHCYDLGMYQLLPTVEQISSNRSTINKRTEWYIDHE